MSFQTHLRGFTLLKHQRFLILPVVVWLVVFQIAGRIPTEIRPTIDVGSLPLVEVMLLGQMPHQFLAGLLGTTVVDLFAAIPYTLHFSLPFVFLAYLVWRHRSRVLPFLFCFGILNLTAVLTQLLFPTAPPWYFEKYGLQPASYSMSGDPGRLGNIDQAFDIQLYHGMYGTSPIVFGSFPSLHAAWPFLIAIFQPNPGRGMFVYTLWVWFGAIYLQHHFIVDIIGAIVYTLASWHITQRVVSKISPQPASTSSTTTLSSLASGDSIEMAVAPIAFATLQQRQQQEEEQEQEEEEEQQRQDPSSLTPAAEGSHVVVHV